MILEENAPFSLMSDEAGRDTSYPKVLCGESRPKLNPKTGLWKVNPWLCHDYRNCENCKGLKQQANKIFLMELLQQGNMRYLPSTLDTSILNKQFGVNEVKHYPQSDGTLYSVIHTTDESIGIPLTTEIIEQLALKSIPPDGKRLSGKLGSKPTPLKEPTEENTAIESVEVRTVRILDKNGNPVVRQIVSKLEREVTKNTMDLEPKTVEELQQAIIQVEEEMVKVAQSKGYETLFILTEVNYIKRDEIKWGERKEWLKNSQLTP